MKQQAARKLRAAQPGSIRLRLRPDGKVSWQRMNEANIPREVILKLPTAGQLLSEQIPERRFLLRPWFRQQESVLLEVAVCA
jgi:hypothetical protein